MTKKLSLTIVALLLCGFVRLSQQKQEGRNIHSVYGWTEWFDRDNPVGNGDMEDFSSLQKENPWKICQDPVDIEARTLRGCSVQETGEKIYRYDTVFGFICRNSDQRSQKCQDYKVRFSCPVNIQENVRWTKWYNQDHPSGSGDWEYLSSLIKENPEDNLCSHPLYIEAVTVDGEVPAHETGQKFHFYNPDKGLVCRNSDQKSGKCKDYKVRFGCTCRFDD
ncbi:cartilage intermediate layer protein 1-like [Anableps anableps]